MRKMSNEEESRVFGIRLKPHEREKYEAACKEFGFKTMAEFFRETANIYIVHPEVRDPTIGEPEYADIRAGIDRYYELKTAEDNRVLEAVTNSQVRIDVLERKIDLLLQQANIEETDIKEAEGQDIAEELIFDEE